MRYSVIRSGGRVFRTSIGIPTYNGAQRVEWLLRSIRRHGSVPSDTEITLLDDGSTRGDQLPHLQRLAQEYNTSLIRHHANEGITRSWNDLVKFVDSQFCILLNDDLFVLPNWLSNMVYFLENNWECGAASWNTLFCNDSDVPALDAGAYVVPRHPETRNQEPSRGEQSPDEAPGVVMCALGCGFGFRRAVFDALGGFDERTVQIYNESLPGHEYVLVREKSTIRLTSFDELWAKYGKDDEGEQTLVTPPGLECLSAKIVQTHRPAFLTGHQKLALLTGQPKNVLRYTKKKIENFSYVEGEWQKVTRLIRHRRHNKIFHVRQKSGSVFVTENHSMVVSKDGVFEIAKPSEFKTKTIPRPEFIPLPETRTRLDLGEYLTDWDQHKQDDESIWYLGKNNRGRISERRASKKIPRWFDLTSSQGEALCWLLGFHVAEGSTSISKNYGQIITVVASNGDEALIEKTIALTKSLFGLEPYTSISKKGRYKPVTNVYVGHKALGTLLRKMCGVGARNKFVPDFLYDAPAPCRAAFLSGYVAGDGWSIVSKDGLDEVIQAETVSRKLAAGLSILCSSLEKLLLIHYRPQYQSYAIRTVMHTRPNRDTKNVDVADDQTEFVYDFEVENSHVFCAGVGPVVVHNSWFGTKAARDLRFPSYCIPAPRVWHLWSATFKENPELHPKMGGDRAAYEREFGGNFEVTHPRFMVGTMSPRVVKWIGPDGQPRERELVVQ